MNAILFKMPNILQIKMRKIVMPYFYSFCIKQNNQQKMHHKNQQLIFRDFKNSLKRNHLIIIKS